MAVLRSKKLIVRYSGKVFLNLRFSCFYENIYDTTSDISISNARQFSSIVYYYLNTVRAVALKELIAYNSDWTIYFHCLNKTDLNELDNPMLIHGSRKPIAI